MTGSRIVVRGTGALPVHAAQSALAFFPAGAQEAGLPVGMLVAGALAFGVVGFGLAMGALLRRRRVLESAVESEEDGPSRAELLAALARARVDVTRSREELADAIGEVAMASQEREELERELRQVARMETMGRLAGGVAHDFNNVLTALMNYVEVARIEVAGRCDRERLAHYLEQLAKSGEHAGALTRQLLLFSRQASDHVVALDPERVIRELLPLLERLVREDIALELRLGGELGAILADASQLDQVLLNLIVNASDAMPDGGELTIATYGRDVAAPLRLPTGELAPGAYIVIEVTDTGAGIDADALPRIFEPFFTTKDAGHGTGLGLSSVRDVVRRAGGGVEVESALGAGSSFRVLLPRVAARAPAAGVAPVLDEQVGGDETILICDDDPAVLGVMRTVLEGVGYNVLTASGPEGAMELARGAQPIHLFITDVVMPAMSGRALSDELRKLRPAAALLFVSGYSADVVVSRGVDDPELLEKPFTAHALQRRVRDLLQRR